ncbi:MAG: M14 family zinc carboxypeptidase [Bacteroidia bacterium]|nr:M14 family zinc carboxypeptidase [Bacteroidia bacterium]MDW8158142.1 M14 family zinc carboxypeptidase [Bacteroidia bacterium]
MFIYYLASLVFWGVAGISKLLIAQNFITPFERSKGRETATYQETIEFYSALARKYPKYVRINSYGATDAGKPLHLVILSQNSIFLASEAKKKNKRIFLINNAIHPGEPDGVDASMLFARDWAMQPQLRKMLSEIVILIIPIYNIEGALNRGCCSRANQNGPIAYGFRGNGQNLDLNRDFIKCDSRNARTFIQIFQEWDPDFLADNHTTNGADYQYTMTLLATQHNKLGLKMGNYLKKELLPQIYNAMDSAGYAICPYVYTKGETPESGIIEFWDTPRYSTGYAALFHCFGFVPEAHMLKPFKNRVMATYTLMHCLARILNRNAPTIAKLRQESKQQVVVQEDFALSWNLDTLKVNKILFKGYAVERKPSKITQLLRLYYNHNEPYEKEIAFYDEYSPTLLIKKPLAYIIPQAWYRVIELLKLNQVVLHRLRQDTVLEVEVYYIEDYKTLSKPYEHHYLHYEVKVRKEIQHIQYFAGDYVIITDQPRNRYIIETLEPQGEDSFFCWNFFDSILQQKEYYSDYIFEEVADSLLQVIPELKLAFEKKRIQNIEFSKNARAQLDFIYYHSPYYEKQHNRYPITRYLKNIDFSFLEKSISKDK